MIMDFTVTVLSRYNDQKVHHYIEFSRQFIKRRLRRDLSYVTQVPTLVMHLWHKRFPTSRH
jgi:hypothetical protein